MRNTEDKIISLSEARIRWARHRTYQFNAEADVFLEGSDWRLERKTRQLDADRSEVRWLLKGSDAPPVMLRFAAGDAVHNLRAVIDSLVRAAAVTHGAKPSMGLAFRKSKVEFGDF